MVRYLDVIAGDAERMRIARVSRGDDPRWIWQAQATASTAGLLFVRSYERGERVHLAMAARGFTGTMPPLHHAPRRRGDVALAASLPLAAAALAVVAHVTT
jgi:cobalt/nickel transport system permease protein